MMPPNVGEQAVALPTGSLAILVADLELVGSQFLGIFHRRKAIEGVFINAQGGRKVIGLVVFITGVTRSICFD